MQDKIDQYRARMAQHSLDSLQYCMDLLELGHLLFEQGRAEEGLNELRTFLSQAKGDVFQLLSVLNLFAHHAKHLPDELQPVFKRIYQEGGFQAVDISKPLRAIQAMHQIHLRSNQAFSLMVLQIQEPDMDVQAKKRAITEYLNGETLPFYRGLAEKLLNGI